MMPNPSYRSLMSKKTMDALAISVRQAQSLPYAVCIFLHERLRVFISVNIGVPPVATANI
jgi:hypothetical protein